MHNYCITVRGLRVTLFHAAGFPRIAVLLAQKLAPGKCRKKVEFEAKNAVRPK